MAKSDFHVSVLAGFVDPVFARFFRSKKDKKPNFQLAISSRERFLGELKTKMLLFFSKSGMARVIIALIVIILLSGTAIAYIAFKPPASSRSSTLVTTPSPSPSPSTMPSPTPSYSPTPSPTPGPSSSPQPSQSPSPTPTQTPSPTASPTPKPTPTPSPTPTPTPAPTSTHTVTSNTMITGDWTDYWNVSLTTSYDVTLSDSMTVTRGAQQLGVWAYDSTDLDTQSWIWNVNFMNSTFAYYWVNTGAGNGPHGQLAVTNGVIFVEATSTQITFISGANSVPVSIAFQNVEQIQTQNMGDDKTSGIFNGGTLTISVH